MGVHRALGVLPVVVGRREEDRVAARKIDRGLDEPPVEIGAVVRSLVGPQIGPARGEGRNRPRRLAPPSPGRRLDARRE
jgi:hypothetical protein